MKKSRNVIRRKMKAEKKIMHKKEAEWERESQLRKEQGQSVRCGIANFHRSPNHRKSVKVPSIQIRRLKMGMEQQLYENNMMPEMVESDSMETCESVIEQPRIKNSHKRVVRPLYGSMHYVEEAVNAREFARAICDLRVTRKEILAQKAGNV